MAERDCYFLLFNWLFCPWSYQEKINARFQTMFSFFFYLICFFSYAKCTKFYILMQILIINWSLYFLVLFWSYIYSSSRVTTPPPPPQKKCWLGKMLIILCTFSLTVFQWQNLGPNGELLIIERHYKYRNCAIWRPNSIPFLISTHRF